MSFINRGVITRRGITRRGIAAAGAAVLTAVALTGCGSSSNLGGDPGSSTSASGSAASGGAVTIGSANFPENVTIAYIYGQELAKSGFTVSYKVDIGARAAYIPALEKGEVNFIPEYAGSILSFLNNKASATSASDVQTALKKALPKGLTALDFAQAADSDSLNVTPSYAAKNGLKSIADLKKLKSFTIAANTEFATRPDGVKGLQSVYGLNNLKFKAINDGGGPATLKALLGDQVQVADIYSTTPSILANKLVTLSDPKSLFASQQIVPIVSTSKATAAFDAAVNKVSAVLTTKDLLALNDKVSGSSKTDPKTAAADYLTSKGL